jgi:two-component system, NarL family, response regulator DesR
VATLGAGDNPFTERERAVLAVAAAGASVAEIADQLSLSQGTVRNYLSTAIQKVNAQNRVEAARIAERNGWL